MNVTKHLLNDIKPLREGDTLAVAIEAMHECKFEHFPVVVHDNLYLGLVNDEDLLEVPNDEESISKCYHLVKKHAINQNDHVYNAVKMIGEANLSLLPIVDDNGAYKGYISTAELLQDLGGILSFSEPGGILVLRVDSRDYQLSQVSQIVESNDGKIIGVHLNEDENDLEKIRVVLKINQTDLSRIVKSFERYNYEIVEVFHQSVFGDNLGDRYDAFMKYLNM